MKDIIDFDIERLDKGECEEEIKNFAKRGRIKCRFLERIGRRMIITQNYDARKVYPIILKFYRDDSFDEVNKKDLKLIAKGAKDEDLAKIVQELFDSAEVELSLAEVFDERDNYLLDNPMDKFRAKKDLEDLEEDECLEKIKTFHRRGRGKARSLENIGRRMIITDNYDPRIVYLMISNLYERELHEQIEKNTLKSIAEDAKEDELITTYQKLKSEVGEEFLSNGLKDRLDRAMRASELESKFKQINFPSNFQTEKRKFEKEIEKISEKDMNEIEILEDQLDDIQSKVEGSEYKYIDPFVEKYKRGNPEAREKLLKTINRQIDKDIELEELNEKIEQEVECLEREAVSSVLELGEGDNLDDRIKYFVKVFGTGNSRLVNIGSELMDIDRSEFSDRVNEVYREMQEELELHEFQSNLGLDTETEMPDFRISRNEIENLEHPEIIEGLRQRSLSWQDIESMSGLEFEGFLEELFNSMGYDAWQTDKSGDQGADVIAEKVGEKVAIQAKNKNSKTLNSAVQEVKAAMEHYNCNKGMVVSTSSYTDSAKELANSNNIELWRREKIMNAKEKYLDETRL
jgi:hypothetical protein